MSNHSHLHTFRVNGKFAKQPPTTSRTAPPSPGEALARRGKRRRTHTNLFTPLPDSELLKLCPRKFRDLAEMLFRRPGAYGYKGHRLLLCTYLQAIENLRRLEGKMGEVFVNRARFYGATKVMGKLRGLKLMDLYNLCQVNGIQVPFGTERGQMLEWLETRCEEGVLLLEPYSEPEGDQEGENPETAFKPLTSDSETLSSQDASRDGSGEKNTPGAQVRAKNAMSETALKGEGQ